MTGGCTYLQLYDVEAGTWTEWGETVQEAMPAARDNPTPGNLKYITDCIDGDNTAAFEAFRERHDIPPYDEAPSAITEGVRSARGYRYRLLATKVFLDEQDLEPCPHDRHEDEIYCLYHLSPQRKEELGIATADVRDVLLDEVNTRSGMDDGVDVPPNYFVGARLRELRLDREILDANDNVPVDLRFTAIERLALKDTEINQGLTVDNATIGEVDVNHSDIRRDVTFEDAVFEGNVTFEDVTVTKGRVSFKNAVFCEGNQPSPSATVSFENSTFAGREVNFSGVTCYARRALFSSTDFDGRMTTFEHATFEGYQDPEADPEDEFPCRVRFENSSFTGERTSFAEMRVRGDAQFEATRFDDKTTDYSELTVGGVADFTDADFNYVTRFQAATFGERAVFDSAGFSGSKLVFDGAECTGTASFRGAVFGAGADFSRTAFDDGARFDRATFGGDEVTFGGVRFGDDTTFTGSSFNATPGFTSATFCGAASFDDVTFGGQQAVFDATEFEGRATFERTWFEAGADFTAATFGTPKGPDEGEVSPVFELVQHTGGVLTFEDALFRAGAVFDKARFEGREVDFSGTVFDGAGTADGIAAGFVDCRFDTDRALYDRASFHYGDVDFESTVFHGCTVSFTDVGIYGLESESRSTCFAGVAVHDGLLEMRGLISADERFELTERGEQFAEFGFPERRIVEMIREEDGVQKRDIRPEGGDDDDDAIDIQGILEEYSLHEDDPLLMATLDHLEAVGLATADGQMPTTPVASTPVGRTEAEVTLDVLAPDDGAGSVTLRGVRELLDRGLVRRERQRSDTPVDLTGAHIEAGRISQPGAEAKAGATADGGAAFTTIYQLRKSVIGKVHLDARDDQTAFECFEFQETTFDGFEFHDHKDELRANQWTLHRTVNDEEQALSWPNRALKRLFLSSPVSAATSERFSPRELESTYLKAKSGADQVGDNSVASAFFQKELQHRRRHHRQQVGASVSGMKSLYSYVANLLLGVTSGYGERPGRVIVFSLLMVGLFGLVFQLAWDLGSATRPDQYAGLAGALLLSFESFTTLVLGGGTVDDVLVRYIAYGEGFTGAFLIALFVFTLTRSVHR